MIIDIIDHVEKKSNQIYFELMDEENFRSPYANVYSAIVYHLV